MCKFISEVTTKQENNETYIVPQTRLLHCANGKRQKVTFRATKWKWYIL